MDTNISIQERNPFPEAIFHVTIADADGQSKHVVTVHEPYYMELTGGSMSAEELIRKSFEFLLEREPKESILKKFELPKIQKYFPEYEELLKNA